MKKLYTGLKNIVRWWKVIYKDRDWDHYFIYEILKTKLKFQEEHMRKYGTHEDSNLHADQIKDVLRLIEIVQNEKHIDTIMSAMSPDHWSDEIFKSATEKHENARKDLFDKIEQNIEYWWE